MFDKKVYSIKYAQLDKEKERKKQWNKDNPKYYRIYFQEHKKDICEYKQKYHIEHKEEAKKYQKQWYENNKEHVEIVNKKWAKDNPEKVRTSNKQWRKNNPEYYKQYNINRRKTDLKFNLNGRIKVALNISLKGNKNGRHWETLVGYTLSDLIKHLNKTIPNGYYWRDFLEGKLHIDHIIPISAFNFTKTEHEDFRRCWALNNLRLLPAMENIIKSNKLIKPFQPALAM